jgi:hypothetical protein
VERGQFVALQIYVFARAPSTRTGIATHERKRCNGRIGGHDGTRINIATVAEHAAPADNSVGANVHVRTDGGRHDNGAFANVHTVTNGEWREQTAHVCVCGGYARANLVPALR